MILLALARHASPHALLVLYGGALGSALLSLPTREYFQSSSWSPPPKGLRSHSHTNSNLHSIISTSEGVESVRSGSEFWAGRRSPDSSGFTMGDVTSSSGNRDSGYSEDHEIERKARTSSAGESFHPLDDDEEEEDGDARSTHTTRGTTLPRSLPNTHTHMNGHSNAHTHLPQHMQNSNQTQPLPPPPSDDPQDEEGAHSAFVAGMIWSLSRRLLPGAPYTPVYAEEKEVDVCARWRLDECLRFATECAGRRASGCEWANMAADMRDVGWFD